MMNEKEIGEKAWKKLLSNAAFQKEVPKVVFSIFEPIVMAIPGLFGEDLLKSPASLKNIAKAKAIVVRYAIESDFVPNYLDAVGLGSDMFDPLKGAMEAIAQELGDMVENSVRLLEDAGVSEEAVLINMGLDVKLAKKCQQGAMTIEELFVNHPYVVLKNTD